MVVGYEIYAMPPSDTSAAGITVQGAVMTREAQNSAPGLRELTLTVEAAAQMRAMLDDPNTPRHEGATLPTIDAATLLRRR